MRQEIEDRPIGYNPEFVRRALQKRQHVEREARVKELLREAAEARRAIETKKAAKTSALDDVLRAIPRTKFERIVRRAVLTFGIRTVHLKGASRTRDVVLARQFIYYWACRLTSLSTPQIGKLLGGRDHTTCLSGVHAYRAKRARMGRFLPPPRGAA